MRSSIFNSNYSDPFKIIATMAIVIVVAWMIIPAHLASDDVLPISSEIANEFVLEQYNYVYEKKPVVIVGSSVTTMIPSPYCRPDNVATIPLQGRSALTGLEAIWRLGAKPDVLFVEVPTLTIGVDEQLIKTVFPPLYWRVRVLVRPLRLARNWLILLYQMKQLEKSPFTNIIPFPSMSVTRWNDENAANFAPVIKGSTGPSGISYYLPTIRKLIHALQLRGTRIIFFDPIDLRARKILPDKELHETLRTAFPDIPIVDAPDNKVPIYRHDGMHMDQSSGLQFFNYLMDYAGVKFTPKCQLVGQPTP